MSGILYLGDGTGRGYVAKVDSTNRLSTRTIVTSSQNFISRISQEAYQTFGTASIDTSEVPVLLLKNTSAEEYIVISYIRIGTASAAAKNENAYFKIMVGGDYVSGGSAMSPVNMYVSTAKEASADAYSGSTPMTISGFSEIDRSYEVDEIVYNKQGSIILDTSQSIAVSHVGSTAAGTAYARFSFYYIAKGDV